MDVMDVLWPLALVACVFIVCAGFVTAVRIGANSADNNRHAADNRRLRAAIHAFLAAQDQPPGNWDAIDQLRAAADK